VPARPFRHLSPALVGGVALAALLAGCSLPGTSTSVPGAVGVKKQAPQTAALAPPKLAISPANQSQNVPLDSQVVVTALGGTLTGVSVQEAGASTPPPGQLSADGKSWRLAQGLDPGATYTVTATAGNGAQSVTSHATFSTLTAAGRLITSFTPYDGETVGVGEPIDLHFNTPIPDSQKAALLQRIQVSSTPAVLGAWHWFSDSEVHFRPQSYWQSGTKVTVTANLKGFDAGNGVWGLGNWSTSFTVGPKHVSIIDDTTHLMNVYANNQLIDTWPVSMGKSGFATLSGTLVVLYKQYDVKMNSCSTFGNYAGACDPGSPNYYNEDVYYDTAVSTNGYFIHAAPWSVYAQGRYDVSHGCINLSTPRAITFFNWSQVGDVVVVEHTSNPADYSDGEADWQIPFAQFSNTQGFGAVWTGPTGSPLSQPLL
jgi:lipoprotein-anchoring transpeptidase ErfK/SrfK